MTNDGIGAAVVGPGEEWERMVASMSAAPATSAITLGSTIHVLLILPSTTIRAELLRALAAKVRVTTLELGRPLPRSSTIDVAVVHVDALNIVCSSLLCDAKLGFPELVFVVDDTGSPPHFALKTRGFRHIVSHVELIEWFPTIATQLGSLAQARRIVLDAYSDDGTNRELLPTPRPRGIRLHAAESSFRETFLRSLLAECGSRRKAAAEAGVPYRSFCEMLRKLGI